MWIDEVAEPFAGVHQMGGKCPVRLGKDILHDGERAGEVAQHADGLRPLTGNSETELARGTGAVGDAVGGMPGLLAGVGGEQLAAREATAAGSLSRVRTKTSRCAEAQSKVDRDAAAWSRIALHRARRRERRKGRLPFTRAPGFPCRRAAVSIHPTFAPHSATICTSPSQSGTGFVRRVFFQHAMEIRAAEAESADAGPPRMAIPGSHGRGSVFT